MAVFSPHLQLWLEALVRIEHQGASVIPRKDLRVLEDLAPGFSTVQQPDFSTNEQINSWSQSASWQSRFLTLAGEQSRMIGGGGEAFTVPDSAAAICKKYLGQFAEILRAHLEPSGPYYLTTWGIALDQARALHDGSPRLVSVASDSSDEQWWTTPQYLSPRASHITYSRRFIAETAWLSTLTCAEIFTEDRAQEIVQDMQSAADIVDRADKRAGFTWDFADDLPVYRIRSGADFSALTARFPLELRANTNHILKDRDTIGVPVDVIPNWSQVAQHYCGVFLEAEAFLGHTWLPLRTPYGTTAMTGWAPQTLYRLR